MNILVVNDDGIDALGLHKLAEALSKIASVYVCAPHVEQSGSGHGITIGKTVVIEEVEFPEAVMAISLEGKPADCVKIGIAAFRDRNVKIDMVVSGFNHGMNLGTATLYSGTVAGAIEGALCGLPAIAFSISATNATKRIPQHFDTAMKVAELIVSKVMSGDGMFRDDTFGSFGFEIKHNNCSIINVNFPDLPSEIIKGTKIVPIGYREHEDWFTAAKTENGQDGYRYSGRPHHDDLGDENTSDIIANAQGYITITPLQFDLTNFKAFENTKDELENVLEEI